MLQSCGVIISFLLKLLTLRFLFIGFYKYIYIYIHIHIYILMSNFATQYSNFVAGHGGSFEGGSLNDYLLLYY